MRFYKRTGDDKLNAGRRSLSEAERGQVHLALERLQDLAEEFPNDPEVLYVEGLLRQDHLGQGIEARELFERVYHLIPPNDLRLGETRAFAACNAAGLSRDEAEVLRWLELALKAGPDDRALHQFANGMRTNLGQGVAYRDILWNRAAECQDHGVHGKTACLIELLLDIKPPMELTKEVEARRRRAQALRELDRKAMTQRDASWNIPMPDERMALQEGLRELEQALELDPYDAELWNFRSAWCVLLERYEEAIPHAEKALGIRPHGYVKPLINKATALGFLGRYTEAEAIAQEAIDRAADSADRTPARNVQESCRKPPAPLTPRMVRDLSRVAWDEARNTANDELGAQGGGPSRLADGIMKRISGAGQASSVADARVLAELLNDFFPETVFVALSQAERTHFGVLAKLSDAAQHLVTHATGVVRRDATRFLVLTILRAGNASAIRSEYRRLFPAPPDATMDSTETVDPTVHRVLASFHPDLPAFLAGRGSIEDEGARSGCGTLVSALVLFAAVGMIVVLY